MTIKNFIPTIWSARLLKHFEKDLVFGDVVNKEYEGEIKSFGDRIKINALGPAVIKDYVGGQLIDEPDTLTSIQATLNIDKGHYFNFAVEDVISAQSNIALVDNATQAHSFEIQSKVDATIAKEVDKAKINIGEKELTVDNAYDLIVDIGVELDKKDVPRGDRFIVLPPEWVGLLNKDPRFTRMEEVLANGYEGNIAGFDVRKSTNIPLTKGKYKVMAGSKSAIAFAGQFSEVQAYKPERAFADAVKGLYIYGVETIRPEALAKVVVEVKAEETTPEETTPEA